MNEPKIIWYWESIMLDPDERGFYWCPISTFDPIFVVKCKAYRTNSQWNVCRVEFDLNTTEEQIQQTMDTLLDVCRMRYADELLNQGERK